MKALSLVVPGSRAASGSVASVIQVVWGQPESNCGHDLWEYHEKRGEATEAVEYSMGDKYLQETFPDALLLHNMNQRTNGDSWEERRVGDRRRWVCGYIQEIEKQWRMRHFKLLFKM